MKQRLQSVLAVAVAVFLAGAGCGNLGNYSNDDVDFQLVVPEREDLVANLTAQQALVVGNAAEYLRITREAVTRFNLLVDGLVGIVNAVRTLTPSERHGEVRIWGPFPHEEDPSWQVRMRLTRGLEPQSPTGRSFTYQIEYRRVGSSDASWAALMSGTLIPGAGVRRGSGKISLAIGRARTAGYPVGGFDKLDSLQVIYQRATYPITVGMEILNTADSESPGGSFKYSEDADGAGAMDFVWRTRENIWAQAIGIYSRWRPGGAGRADARVTEGLAAAINAAGIDCWAADGHATYVRRDFEQPKREEGDPATCVLGPPVF
jgi:hypothetical protein